MIEVARIGGARVFVLDLRRGGRAAGHGAAQEQRGGEAGVDQAGEEADAGEAARGVEARTIRATVPARQVQADEGFLDQPQVEVLTRWGREADELLGGQLALRHEESPLALAGAYEQVTLGEVALDTRRKEELPLRVLDDRLEASEQGQVGGVDGHATSPPSSTGSLPASTLGCQANAIRTSR